MKTVNLGTSGLTVPCIAVGCMRINKLEPAEAEHFVHAAIDQGAYFFDHADIYGNGDCETVFAKAIRMNSTVREKVLLQSKCGIRRGVAFDFSRIISSNRLTAA